MVSDQELVAQIQQGDDGAFETLYDRYESPIFRHLLRLTSGEPAAQDLLQEAFLRVWTCSEQWDGRGSFKGWLYKIATNLAINYLRTMRRRRELFLFETETNPGEEEGYVPASSVKLTLPGPQEVFEQSEEYELFQQILASMPEEKQRVFRLVNGFDMSIQDAACLPESTRGNR